MASAATTGGHDFHSALNRARRELLDLSVRNRLLHTPRGTGRSSRLEIVGHSSTQVFDYLVVRRRKMYFAAAKQPALPDDSSSAGIVAGNDASSLAIPIEDGGGPIETNASAQIPIPGESDSISNLSLAHADEEQAPPTDPTDNKLQTTLSPEQLQYRLRRLLNDARTYEEELGVNILYLALGFLKWFEPDRPQVPRFAPLILVPVSLRRASAWSRFTLEYREEEITTNLSLQARLRADHQIALPDIPATEDLDPQAYFAEVRSAIAHLPAWEVLPNDIVLWFFSFSKFLIYRDLDPDLWPEHARLEDHPLLGPLLGTSAPAWKPLCDSNPLEDFVSSREEIHVLDADGSQAVALRDVQSGCSLVIQGPPGTGKSQTIANLIAAAVVRGKKVLFVAEKLAALEVVYRRLAQLGIADVALELHSHKASKQMVLEQLRSTLQLPLLENVELESYFEQLDACRRQLDEHLIMLHAPIGSSGQTPYQVLGTLVRLRHSGIRPQDLPVGAVEQWTAGEVAKRREALEALKAARQHLDRPPVDHPWRGVEFVYVLPSDRDRLIHKVQALEPLFATWQKVVADAAQVLELESPRTIREASALVRWAELLGAAPPLDHTRLADASWEKNLGQLEQLVAAGKRLRQIRDHWHRTVAHSAWRQDWSVVYQTLQRLGPSLWRFFNPSYYTAIRQLRRHMASHLPRSLEERLSLLRELQEAQQVESQLTAPSSELVGKRAFGVFWRGVDSDWNALEEIVAWRRRVRDAAIPEDWLRATAARPQLPTAPPTGRVIQTQQELLAQLENCVHMARLDTRRAFGVVDVQEVPLETLRGYFLQWCAYPEQLDPWVQYRTREKQAMLLGLEPWCRALAENRIGVEQLVETWQASYAEALLRVAFEQRPCLARFSAEDYQRQLQTFCRLDRQRMHWAVQEVQLAHRRMLPRLDTPLGEMAVLSRELAKKTRHLPIRKLLSEAGRVIQQIKPVFLMSPLSVAQYLEPGAVAFDWLLIDEASQIEPVDAFGAIARCRQIVVVGDSKQLPPTPFFQRLAAHEVAEATDDATSTTADLESILSLCLARQMPSRMLRWHYRSRHHSLIAVSNREFYDNQLIVIPSPTARSPDQGLEFRYVAEGRYDRGKSATNRPEALAVAQAIIQHAQSYPHLSLGVGTLSLPQRDAIEDQLERLRREHPECEPFFSLDGPEPFFVKNLENIQGDERDVIFISIGYGPDHEGHIHYNFGPISQQGGERRLNVLITRARKRCIVFSSLRANQLDLSRATGVGARVLRTFLEFAERGDFSAPDTERRTFVSDLDHQIAQQLAEHGYRVAPSVGLAGLYVELAVRDPKEPNSFILGLDVDGPQRLKLPSTRDRERIRPEVLVDRGWKLHRTWTIEWYRRPEYELRRLLSALQSPDGPAGNGAVTSPKDPDVPEHPSPRSSNQTPTELTSKGSADASSRSTDRNGGNATTSSMISSAVSCQPYRVALLRVPRRVVETALQDENGQRLAKWVRRIIQFEGPIHSSLIARRIAHGSQKRCTAQLRRVVSLTLEHLVAAGEVRVDGPFYYDAHGPLGLVRNRDKVPADDLRDPRMLPPVEIRQALLALAEVYVGVTQYELVQAAAQLLGVSGQRKAFQEAVEIQIRHLVSNHQLIHRKGRYYAATQCVDGNPSGISEG